MSLISSTTRPSSGICRANGGLLGSADHTPLPHPASPSGSLPGSFGSSSQASSHTSFSSYRDHAQQFGPLRKTVKSGEADPGIGGSTGAELGPVTPPKGIYFDRNELPAPFQRKPISLAEIEALESGGASAYA